MQHVLLLDDDATQLKIREMILRSAGIQVSIATKPESALALLRSAGAHFGAVVTDHLLQGQTGADFVRELRKFEPGMSILVLTGMGDVEDEYEGLDVDIRQKPLPPDELIALVRMAIERAA